MKTLVVSRKAVLAKTKSRCAYCGRPITARTMERDHVKPILRFRGVRWTFSGKHGCKHPENHNLDNIVAACKACNQDKGSLDLATWRGSLRWLGWQNGVVFWFERCK